MCKSTTFYPLYRNPVEDKQKIEFRLPVDMRTRVDFDDLHLNRLDCKLGMNHYTSKVIEELKKDGFTEFVKLVKVPCGACSECLKTNAQAWSFRILKEAELYDNNYFVTLTYDDEHLPANKMLVKDEISKFNKKLKTYLNRAGLNSDFRFYGVGEYGGQTARPHYHVIYFNLDLPDLKFELVNNGNMYFSSQFLSKCWAKGHIMIGNVDEGSACYVARYCDKKKLLSSYDKEELIKKGIVPEFSIMSRMPGIGAHYVDKVFDNVVSQCYNIFVKGRQYSIPQFYSKKVKALLVDSPEVLDEYERQASLKSFNKLSGDIICHQNIEEYYRSLDANKIQNKKGRKL